MAFPYTVQAANEVLRAAEELADATSLDGITVRGTQRFDAALARVVRTVGEYRAALDVPHVNGPDIDAIVDEPEVFEVVNGWGEHVTTYEVPPDLYACPRGGVEIARVPAVAMVDTPVTD